MIRAVMLRIIEVIGVIYFCFAFSSIYKRNNKNKEQLRMCTFLEVELFRLLFLFCRNPVIQERLSKLVIDWEFEMNLVLITGIK